MAKQFRLIPLVLALVLALLLGMLGATPAGACSCAGRPTPGESLRDARAVFSGRVVGISEDVRIGGIRAVRGKARFEVERVWKSISSGSVTLPQGANGGDCSYEFRQGERYLVYAVPPFEGGNSLSTNTCTRTTLLSGAGEDLRALGPGTLPAATSPSGGTNVWALVAAGGGAVAVLLLAVATWRRRAPGPA